MREENAECATMMMGRTTSRLAAFLEGELDWALESHARGIGAVAHQRELCVALSGVWCITSELGRFDINTAGNYLVAQGGSEAQEGGESGADTL